MTPAMVKFVIYSLVGLFILAPFFSRRRSLPPPPSNDPAEDTELGETPKIHRHEQ